jgi:transposase
MRFNVLGAIDAVTHELVTVTNCDYVNSACVCELLDKLSALCLKIPITVVLDNARYQRCKMVIEHAANLEIELLFLPPYSPNLNLIERLWKFVKKECLYGKYYSTFDEFKSSISSCLEHTNTTYSARLDSLLALNFQTFPKCQK